MESEKVMESETIENDRTLEQEFPQKVIITEIQKIAPIVLESIPKETITLVPVESEQSNGLIDESQEMIVEITEKLDSSLEKSSDSIILESAPKEKITSAPVEAEKSNELIDESQEMIVENSEKFDSNLEGNNENQKTKMEEEEPNKLQYDWLNSPRLLCSATEEYKPNNEYENFTKGCQWSPDGTCLLVPTEDFRLRVYELPRALYSGKIPQELPLAPLSPVLKIKEGGIIYDSSWYPLMNSWSPDTCCFISTSKETPVHLWDAFTGELRATYRAYNQVDEVEAAISVQFTDQGQTVWAGFKGALRSFDTNRPGRQVQDISLKNDFPNVSGIVSCIRENPMMPGLLAFGTYSKCIGLYSDGPLCSFKTSSGVTQIEFSPCGTKLYSSVRRNNEFLCWDLRNPGIILHAFEKRQANTNQRIQFSLSSDGREIISGGTDGFVTLWRLSEDVSDEIQPVQKIQISKDCINGVNLHRSLPILATASGQRLCEEDETLRDNSVRLWYCGATS